MTKRSRYLLLLLLIPCLVACRSKENTSHPKGKELRIGILQYMEHDSLSAARKGFEKELVKAGYKKGHNMVLDYQNAQGEQAQLQTIAEKMVAKDDLILAIATPATQALARVSSETPILFTAVTDPVSAGLVDSIQKPGGLITGTSDLAPIDKQIGSAQQALPQAKKVGILYTTSEGNSEVQVKEASKEFEKKGYQIIKKGISSSNDVQDATASLMKDVDFVFVPTDNTIASTMSMIGELSRTHKVPVIGGSTDMVDAGGLLTYGTNYEQLGRQVARMAIQVLKGKNPADLAVQYPKKLDLHINHEMAQQLGIDLSQLTKD